MMDSANSHYLLYETFSRETIPKKDLSAKQKAELAGLFDDLDEDYSKAILGLICEHYSRSNRDRNLTELPYSIEELDDGSVSVDIKNLPAPLRWILWKFSKVLKQEEA